MLRIRTFSSRGEHKSFNIDIECMLNLKIDEIWPDGDAPENPTPEDVAKVIKNYYSVSEFLRDWNLEDSCTVIIS